MKNNEEQLLIDELEQFEMALKKIEDDDSFSIQDFFPVNPLDISFARIALMY